jgi:hypothetical protein
LRAAAGCRRKAAPVRGVGGAQSSLSTRWRASGRGGSIHVAEIVDLRRNRRVPRQVTIVSSKMGRPAGRSVSLSR